VPPAPVVAIEHDQAGFALTRTITVNGEEIAYQSLDVWASLAGYADLPVTTAPVGISAAGLPVGVQIIGPNMEDRTPIAFAKKLAELTGGFESPPNY
jgi:amidase